MVDTPAVTTWGLRRLILVDDEELLRLIKQAPVLETRLERPPFLRTRLRQRHQVTELVSPEYHGLLS